MRLWTLHPRYLDSKGLTALWREGLLALAVLEGRTKGYRLHPQIHRFSLQPDPPASVRKYLAAVLAEADARGFKFDRSKIGRSRRVPMIVEHSGQLLYEWKHLKRKLRRRNPRLLRAISTVEHPSHHPLFRIVRGPVQEWERVKL